MDPINQINPVLDALRRQLAQNIERLRKAGQLGRGAPAAGAARSRDAVPLDAQVLERLGPSAPELSPAAAARVFVELALVGEFGSEILADPGFGPLVDEVSAAFREDPAVKGDFERMLEDLKRR